MINKISISNFKSIYKQDIELGRVNIFIGENGSGKSNILEAVAMASASNGNELTTEGLINRGVRVTKPSLTFNSFLGLTNRREITIDLYDGNIILDSTFGCDAPDDIYAKWKKVNYLNENDLHLLLMGIITQNGDKNIKSLSSPDDNFQLTPELLDAFKQTEKRLDNSHFLIYNVNTNALRGISNDSKKQPLGINGEGLDVLLSSFDEYQINELKELNFISWLKDIHVDLGDTLKYKGYKLGRSTSDLYFTDKYMQKKNNMFAAENANEGALHVLFYLALFISERTPSFFAIDNVETALNPLLCRQVVKSIVELSKKNNKQVLITTHNPAVIDGLNLNDDEQRLFVVKRTDEGHTKVERIKLKPNANNEKLKLSELWMRGYLGALPSNIF